MRVGRRSGGRVKKNSETKTSITFQYHSTRDYYYLFLFDYFAMACVCVCVAGNFPVWAIVHWHALLKHKHRDRSFDI